LLVAKDIQQRVPLALVSSHKITTINTHLNLHVFLFLSNATTSSPEFRGLPSGGGVV
jgi:hypothetical protein